MSKMSKCCLMTLDKTRHAIEVPAGATVLDAKQGALKLGLLPEATLDRMICVVNGRVVGEGEKLVLVRHQSCVRDDPCRRIVHSRDSDGGVGGTPLRDATRGSGFTKS